MISMDWLPTLLAAAGTQPDPAYPPDGENLLPLLTGGAPPHPRKLFWRYKAGAQRAVRDGDWKYLQIAGNEFLFDVVEDPRERGQSQGPPQGRLRAPQGGLGGLERDDAAGAPAAGGLQQSGPDPGRPLRREEPAAARARRPGG